MSRITPECIPCQEDCPSVFDRVVVRHYIRGGTKVLWELSPSFVDPNPYYFQLQVGESSNPNGKWEDVGIEVVDRYSAVDPTQRAWGNANYTHYRVALETSKGNYYSDAVNGMGVLSRRDWLLAREIIRIKSVEYRKGYAAQEGYLLKRRNTGSLCPVCTDLQTLESKRPDCPTCYGTGFQCGYYYPVSCVWAKLSPKSRMLALDDQRGTVNDVVVSAEMLMTDFLDRDDVWVAKNTDTRYFIHSVQHTAEVRSVPIIAAVEMRPIPFSSVIYSIEIPEQLASLEDF